MINDRIWAVVFTISISLFGGIDSTAETAQAAQTGTKNGLASNAQITVSIAQPQFGFNVLPDSERRLFATVQGGITDAVTWTVKGGATISRPTAHWVDVTAPSVGSSCSIQGLGNNGYTVNSATQFTVTATSAEDPSVSATATINVCNPAVDVEVVPFYTTLYSGQKVDLQAFVWGSVNRNVTWAITSQPQGSDGGLSDKSNQDTVFSATVAGRYTLTATSVADGTKTNTATVYVTGHSMPYAMTPSETTPVDCTVDPALEGKTYDVGPSRSYPSIASVPWPALAPGSTVRIHNDDTTGNNPTTYHEYFQITTSATRTQPLRVCGVPDVHGNLPVIDANNSTGRSDVSVYSAGYTAVGIGKTSWPGLYTGSWNGTQYVILEGLKIQDTKPPYTFTAPSGGSASTWGAGAACVRLYPSINTVIRGLDIYNCGNGLFSDFNSYNGNAVVADTLYEGNHLHQNGVVGSYGEHQFYIQGWNEVVQFNLLDQYQVGAEGSNFKSRGFPDVIRYNEFGDGAARELDLVDNQDAQAYTTFQGYLGGGSGSYHAVYPADEYTADLMAAAIEAHHADYVYGNIIVNSSAVVPIHYAVDVCTTDDNRLGTMWFYSNRFYEGSSSAWLWYMFDTSAGGGNSCPTVEWPQIQVFSDAIWMNSPTKPYFYWNRSITQFTTIGQVVINGNWGSGNWLGGDGTGWASETSPYDTSQYAFQGAGNQQDTTWTGNLIGVPAPPFDLTTFVPHFPLTIIGTALPAFGPRLPVRFEAGPAATSKVPTQPLTAGGNGNHQSGAYK